MSKVIEWEDMSFPERVAIKTKSTKSFLNFTRLWFEMVQGDRLLVNWHHRLMASKIDDLIAGRLQPRNLIINIPPGGTKTEFFSIHFPAYVNALVQEGRLKRFRNLNISFADTLVKRNSRRTRDIIASKEYQELWPCGFGVNQAEEWEIIDTRGRSTGQTVSRSSNGQITGGRGGYYGPDFSGMVMLDDYNKPVDMLSESRRNSANTLLVNTIRSRRGDKSKEHPTPFVSIQQRLHTDDATGFMLSGGMGVNFHHVAIPAMIDEKYIQSLAEPWRALCWETVKDTDYVEVSGTRYWSYWPQMEDVNDLLQLWEKDRYTFLSQYQQNPMTSKSKKATSMTTRKAKAKTIRPTRPNAGVEAWYRKKLDSLITEMNDSVVYWLKANYRASGAMAMDASPAVFMRDAMKKLARQWQKRFDDVAAKLADRFAGQAQKNSDVSLYNALETAGFTVPFKMTSAMNNALQATITENVNLITSIPEQYLTQVQTLVMQSVSLGRDLSTLTDELQKRYGITRRRAALIARDQNNKATAVMQTARQQSLGITEGIWRHSHAGKEPRQSHVKADGEKFDLSKGLYLDGKWTLPGEEINCRCTWSPVIPGLN